MNARIQHVSLPLPPGGQSAARHFYGEVLGLREVPVPPTLSSHNLVWYRLGNTELHLFIEEMSTDRSGRHFCMAVDDVDQVRAKLEGAGIAVVGATPIPGRPRYFCRDPFGNLIEFTTIEHDYLKMPSDG
jgi:catechol 2,3-dioxygenase-like lactoylglutathione lyase family enzyme